MADPGDCLPLRGTIVVRRPRSVQHLDTHYRVEINGRRRPGSLPAHRSLSFDVEPGHHSVQVRVDTTLLPELGTVGSLPWEVEVAARQTVDPDGWLMLLPTEIAGHRRGNLAQKMWPLWTVIALLTWATLAMRVPDEGWTASAWVQLATAVLMTAAAVAGLSGWNLVPWARWVPEPGPAPPPPGLAGACRTRRAQCPTSSTS